MPASKVQVNKLVSICDALSDLVPFAQFKKREKHPWRNVIRRGVNNSHPFFHVFKIA